MNRDALLAIWSLDEMPACGKGMELAQTFLVSAGEGVNRLGIEEPGDRLAELTAAYMALVEHGAGCDDCNEADSPSEVGHPIPEADHVPERNDIPFDSQENDEEFIADKKVGLQAGLDGAEVDDSKSEGWQRGWADAQE